MLFRLSLKYSFDYCRYQFVDQCDNTDGIYTCIFTKSGTVKFEDKYLYYGKTHCTFFLAFQVKLSEDIDLGINQNNKLPKTFKLFALKVEERNLMPLFD